MLFQKNGFFLAPSIASPASARRSVRFYGHSIGEDVLGAREHRSALELGLRELQLERLICLEREEVVFAGGDDGGGVVLAARPRVVGDEREARAVDAHELRERRGERAALVGGAAHREGIETRCAACAHQ